MSAEQRRASLRIAQETNVELRQIIRALGGRDQSDVGIYRIYSYYRPLLRIAADSRSVPSARRLLSSMRRELREFIRPLVARSSTIADSYTERMLSVYSLSSTYTLRRQGEIEDAWLSIYDSQAQALLLAIILGLDTAPLLGDAQRVGSFSPGALVRSATRWLPGIVNGLFILRMPSTVEWYKEAVAWLDTRTTQTCRQVDGQVRPINRPFFLTGTPRYAIYVENPPFHDWCRTAMALVHVDDIPS